MELTGTRKNLSRWLILPMLFAALAVCGCASVSSKGQNMEKAIATVNGEPITRGDLGYFMELAHRREELSSAGNFSINDSVQKLIRDMLLIQESRAIGLENDPDFNRKAEEFLIYESVVRLYKEEVQDKVTVSEEEILKSYNERFDQFTIGLIETPSEEQIRKAKEELDGGKEFDETARKYSDRRDRGEGGDYQGEVMTEIKLASRKALSTMPAVLEKILQMKNGETSGIFQDNGKYYIVKLIERKNAEPGDLAHISKKLEAGVRKEKENARGDEYVEILRAKANIEMNNDLFAEVDLNDAAKNERFKGDKRVLARVDDKVLTLGGFVEMLKDAKPGAITKDYLKGWIKIKLIDGEALRRNYQDKDPELRSRMKSYRDQLLRRAFIEKQILPKINMTQEKLKDYYSRNKENYRRPNRYKYMQITVKEMKTAQEILGELKGGADFSWLATEKSIDSARELGGKVAWITQEAMPEDVRTALLKLEKGQVSPAIKTEAGYLIVKLQDIEKGEISSMDEVMQDVKQGCFIEEVNKELELYISKLKEGADIRINEQAIREIESTLGKVDKKESK